MVSQSQFADKFEEDLVSTTRNMAETPTRANNVRQRKTNASTPSKAVSSEVELEDSTSRMISVLDVFRVFLTLVVVVLALSYYLTSGESFTFNKKPWWSDPQQIARYLRGPVMLTPSQLLAYDGSDPKKPIYLAINGTIFDVSAGSHTYGPGGSYHVFAGRDASRAFVTGCFVEDRTRDLRGAELVYLPVEDDDTEVITSAERKTRAERERREARKRVIAEVQRWHAFYKNSKKYFEVGQTVDTEDSVAFGEPPTLCEHAQKGRPKRSNMNKNKKDGTDKNPAPGKPVQ